MQGGMAASVVVALVAWAGTTGAARAGGGGKGGQSAEERLLWTAPLLLAAYTIVGAACLAALDESATLSPSLAPFVFAFLTGTDLTVTWAVWLLVRLAVRRDARVGKVAATEAGGPPSGAPSLMGAMASLSVAGSAGAVVASLVQVAATAYGLRTIVAVAVLAGALSTLVTGRQARLLTAELDAESRHRGPSSPPPPFTSIAASLPGLALDSVRHTIASPWLGLYSACIAGHMAVSFLLFMAARHLLQADGVTDGGAAYWASAQLWMSLAVLATQIAMTRSSWVQHMSLPVALVLSPAACAACFAVLVAFPSSLSVLTLVWIARKTVNFVLTRPSREALFARTGTSDADASAKIFIDTIWPRLVDLAIAVALDALPADEESTFVIAALGLAICGGWFVAARALGNALADSPTS
jgi:hypothetical protein